MAIIAVFNQKGGVGKTTTALNLLAGIARRGERPWGIDLDAQAHLSHLFRVTAARTVESMYGFFTQEASLDDVAQITRSGVVLCPSHRDLGNVDAMLGKGLNALTRLRHALRAPGTANGSVVIDCSPQLNSISLNAVFASDLVLIPVSCDFLALRGALEMERALNAVEPLFSYRVPRRYVLTRYDARRRMSAEVVTRMEKALVPAEIARTRIRENVKIAESPALALDIFRHAPESPGAQDYEALVDELADAGFVR